MPVSEGYEAFVAAVAEIFKEGIDPNDPVACAAWLNAPRLKAGEEPVAFVEDGKVFVRVPLAPHS